MSSTAPPGRFIFIENGIVTEYLSKRAALVKDFIHSLKYLVVTFLHNIYHCFYDTIKRTAC
jgi:hypothetical protein